MVYRATYRGATFTGPVTVWMGVHTGDPGGVGSNEVQGSGYRRWPVVWTDPIDGKGSLALDAHSPVPAASWGVLTHLSYWDAPEGGTMLTAGLLTYPIATSVGVPLYFPAGTLGASET